MNAQILDHSPTLPIRDHDALREALEQGDVPTLLMVLTHFQGDVAFMERFRPYIGSIFEEPAVIPEGLLAELRERLFRVLIQDPPPADESPDESLWRKMLSTDVGEPVEDEFIPMLKEQMGFEPPEQRSERPGRRAPDPDFKVLVIGAGLTGLLAAIKLSEARYNFEVIEKNPEMGGTWWENTYPGVAVDTPSHFYSYSFELNPEWSHYTPTGPEFQRYLLRVADKYKLRQYVTFETKVLGMVWDDTTRQWEVELQDAKGKRKVRANAVINAHGPLNRWKLPNIPGIGDFQGPVMHTAGWDSSVALKGKRVAMIGTAASAVQLGAAVAPDVGHLTVFQRSRHWVMPNHFVEVPPAVRWAQANIPHYAEWFRFRAYWFAADGLYENIKLDPEWQSEDGTSVSAYNEGVRQYVMQNYREKLKDRPDLLEKLVPDYPVFGKRICMDINWLDTLCRDNVSLEDNTLDHIVEDGIVLKDGSKVEVDVILCATGFSISDMTGGLKIIGRGGRNLKEEWGEDDPRAYLGVTVAGYPNFFLTVGPNSAPNHAGGQNITSETQVHYILECLEWLAQEGMAALEPTDEAQEEFNTRVDATIKGLIWSHPKAKSYYKNSKGRVFMSCPYRLVDYWHMTRRPAPEDYRLIAPARAVA
ncbi:MAG TPA: NAD(P)/FAD-dependent oxidoreductase [Halieaceae bacterium]|jgi:4-hydroxyacetophenone monooxygenase|nr:NAD(P)/FAD-dependent oxidoreductase [Haliea sp.]HBM84606.1 NAD(P)/FAD-dependent oxidoreductase [Halieaceae bacterium]MAY91311.1 FAD-dependent oxidoreductase [Haliea sp.]MBK40800.1 FAD-dependent oxidoreductase [Haliea sp.]HBQ40920.1 NAD(P)/FAD-dependent oxidoreductase [Halieaceae bacterium]HBX72744.1 NAD(P)/FAD-dependent oxidoreductase [Halieaceae bacterium]|tara:strand:- start:29993 stop:31927 length:1935 start_codon:yes stop_codon:yes gene_type:complete